MKRLAVILALSLLAGACGSDDADDTDDGSSPVPASTCPEGEPTAVEPDPEDDGGFPEGLAAAEERGRPEVEVPEGDAPATLKIEDLTVGEGDEACLGDAVAMHYVGVAYSDGEEFDASWDRGEPFPVGLGEGKVIVGWEEGIVGMKVGGRRQLVIPPDMAYGDEGVGPIGPGETLVFVVDLLGVLKGGAEV